MPTLSTSANPWSQRTAPFRQLLQRFTQPAHGLLAELDALDTWCMQLVAPALPGAVTLDSPFAGLHTPDGAAPQPLAAIPAAGGASPLVPDARTPRRVLAPSLNPPASSQAGPPAPANAAASAAASGHSPTLPAPVQNSTAAAGLVLPVRGKPAGTSGARAAGSAHPAETPTSDLPGARTLRPSDLPPASAGVARPTADLTGSPTNPPTPAVSHSVLTPDPMNGDRTGAEATTAAGLRLLATLTTSLYGRASAASPQVPTSSAPRRSALEAGPWRAGDPPISAPPAASGAAPSFAANGVPPAPPSPSAPTAPEPLMLPASPSAMPAAPWSRPMPPFSAPFETPLDADLLADLVNEALLEQARRHGANLP